MNHTDQTTNFLKRLHGKTENEVCDAFYRETIETGGNIAIGELSTKIALHGITVRAPSIEEAAIQWRSAATRISAEINGAPPEWAAS